MAADDEEAGVWEVGW